ncbi:hypothetical protein [Pelagerythrobacter marinus]|uniref:hypothetical protein n=1 Tax=Pelagerythrobacter marinus TaxID=538382 RepID=UPI0020374370|nr:hypothetical protein [Pelagerythrobacter marinus]USA40553.1 hypothetical protein NCF86_05215 [Pelagerythrobacter marinus]WPZ08276.1 hypothetical protein T8T98_07140 [Pelagerythrobacter marinus]
MKRLVPLMLPFALIACGEPAPTAEEKRAAEDRAIAAVEAAQDVPPDPVELEAITYPDIEQHRLSGAGCAFLREGEEGREGAGEGAAAGEGEADLLALAMERGAFVKIDGRIHRLAPDAGSPQLPVMARARYDGREYAMLLDLAEREGARSGMETTDYPARLELRNGRGQVVYGASGIAQCGT